MAKNNEKLRDLIQKRYALIKSENDIRSFLDANQSEILKVLDEGSESDRIIGVPFEDCFISLGYYACKKENRLVIQVTNLEVL